jgi:hypothetical protein
MGPNRYDCGRARQTSEWFHFQNQQVGIITVFAAILSSVQQLAEGASASECGSECGFGSLHPP